MKNKILQQLISNSPLILLMGVVILGCSYIGTYIYDTIHNTGLVPAPFAVTAFLGMLLVTIGAGIITFTLSRYRGITKSR